MNGSNRNDRFRPAVTAGIAVLFSIGCSGTGGESLSSGAMNAWLVESIYRSAEENAVLKQRTFFPYLFEDGTPLLNDLGRVHLGILARHLKEHPGRLVVRRGQATSNLHRARMDTVMDELEAAGVSTHRIHLEDTLPSGDGMESGRVLRILDPKGDGTGCKSSAAIL